MIIDPRNKEKRERRSCDQFRKGEMGRGLVISDYCIPAHSYFKWEPKQGQKYAGT